MREGNIQLAEGDRSEQAIAFAIQYGQIDGEHHKAWVIDQMVRILAAERYEEIIAKACDGEDGPETYDWDRGVAP